MMLLGIDCDNSLSLPASVIATNSYCGGSHNESAHVCASFSHVVRWELLTSRRPNMIISIAIGSVQA